jgi:hypothetical protein
MGLLLWVTGTGSFAATPTFYSIGLRNGSVADVAIERSKIPVRAARRCELAPESRQGTRDAAPWGSPWPPPGCAPRGHSGQTAGPRRPAPRRAARTPGSRFPVRRVAARPPVAPAEVGNLRSCRASADSPAPRLPLAPGDRRRGVAPRWCDDCAAPSGATPAMQVPRPKTLASSATLCREDPTRKRAGGLALLPHRNAVH